MHTVYFHFSKMTCYIVIGQGPVVDTNCVVCQERRLLTLTIHCASEVNDHMVLYKFDYYYYYYYFTLSSMILREV